MFIIVSFNTQLFKRKAIAKIGLERVRVWSDMVCWLKSTVFKKLPLGHLSNHAVLESKL